MSQRQFDRRVFVDTSAYFAFSRNRDENHRRVYIAMQNLVRARHRFITTNFVLAELHALIVSRESAALALEATKIVRFSSDTTIVRVRA
jgi:predicted nucleic acid-binding protein